VTVLQNVGVVLSIGNPLLRRYSYASVGAKGSIDLPAGKLP